MDSCHLSSTVRSTKIKVGFKVSYDAYLLCCFYFFVLAGYGFYSVKLISRV